MSIELLIVDAPNVYAKSHYKLAQLTRDDGVPSGGLYGSIRAIQASMRRFEPERTILCFEGGYGERRAEHPSYKADRPTGRSLFDHIGELRRWSELAGLEHASAPGLEADDCIAHYARGATGDVVIVSSDHDFKRLLSADVKLCRDSTKGVLYTEDDLMREHGVTPRQYGLMACVTGDSSDNVKGVPGLGPKRAVKVLEECGWDLDLLMWHPKCVGHMDTIARNRDLLDFRPVKVVESCIAREPNLPGLLRFYTQWQFRSMLDAIEASMSLYAIGGG